MFMRYIYPDGTVRDDGKSSLAKSAAKPAGKPAAPRPLTTAEQAAKVHAELLAKGITDDDIRRYFDREDKRENDIAALEKQAAEWRQKAQDGRVNGLDHEVAALYRRKADAAQASAERLRSGEVAKAVDLARARELDDAADAYDAKATDTSDSQLRAFYRSRARDCREAASIARGEKLAYDSQGKRLVSGD
jgi:hypothetical protein